MARPRSSFFDYENGFPVNVVARVTNRGIGMWTFPVTDLDEVLGARLMKNRDCFSRHARPGQGEVTVLTPNGFMIELLRRAMIRRCSGCVLRFRSLIPAADDVGFSLSGWREVVVSRLD